MINELVATSNPRAVCVLLFNDDGLILATSRRNKPHEFGLPGGKVDEGETYIDAAVREVFEETGILLNADHLDHIYTGDDGLGYDVTTFICNRDFNPDDAHQCEPGIFVKWVSPRVLIDGPFGAYNVEMFLHAASMPGIRLELRIREYTLFLDDERYPSDHLTNTTENLVVCRSYDQAVQIVETYGVPTHTCFDHDLGVESKTGHEFAKWLVELCLNRESPTPIDYSIHSQNPIGAANIKGLIDGYNNHIRENKQ